MAIENIQIETSGSQYFRLPRTGKEDPIFGLRRNWYYNAEAAGLLKLRRVAMPGRTRGVTLARVSDVCALIEKSNGGARG